MDINISARFGGVGIGLRRVKTHKTFIEVQIISKRGR